MTPESSMKRQRNQRGQGMKLRTEVIEAAMRILDRAPVTELSLRTVAKEAGVAAPSLYRQFEDADTMMREIARECWRQVGLEMLAAVRDHQGSALERLQKQMAAYVRYAMKRPSRYQLLFALPSGWDVEVDGPLRPAYRAVLETVAAHIDLGGGLPTSDAISATILTISFAHGRIALAHLAPTRDGNSASQVEAFVSDTLARLFDSNPRRP